MDLVAATNNLTIKHFSATSAQSVILLFSSVTRDKRVPSPPD